MNKRKKTVDDTVVVAVMEFQKKHWEKIELWPLVEL